MLEEELHYLLMRAFHVSNREVVARVRQDGLLPGQPKVLEYLHEHDGCTQKQLGEGCALDKSSITGLLTRMGRHPAGGARGVPANHAGHYRKSSEQGWEK